MTLAIDSLLLLLLPIGLSILLALSMSVQLAPNHFREDCHWELPDWPHLSLGYCLWGYAVFSLML
jgi:hypothetical protein